MIHYFTKYRRYPERLAASAMCTRRHTLPGLVAFRGQAEVRPPSGQAHSGLVRGQLKAGRRPPALGEVPREKQPPRRSPSCSLRGEWDPGPASTRSVLLTPACLSCRRLKEPSRRPTLGAHPGCRGPKSGFSSATGNGSWSVSRATAAPCCRALASRTSGPHVPPVSNH